MSDGFLARWARRKREVRVAEAPPVDAPAPEQQESEAGDGSLSEKSVAAPLPVPAVTEAEPDILAQLPSLADLTAQTDLTPFLRAGVPAALRNAALRKMWSVDPAIRDFVSEAREYAYDWNTPGGVPGMGPLLPGDDVKAMLSRLFNREPSEEATAEADAPEVETPAEPSPELIPVAMQDPGDQVPEAPASTDPANSPERPATTEIKTVSGARLRRHGGAMPS